MTDNFSFNPITTPNAPAAIGPYSQGICLGNLVFISGQVPLYPASGQVVAGDIVEQAKQVLENLSAVLTAASSDLSNVIKTTVFLKDMNDFAEFNKVYGSYFKETYPARSCVEVARLPRDVLVEIEAVAVRNK